LNSPNEAWTDWNDAIAQTINERDNPQPPLTADDIEDVRIHGLYGPDGLIALEESGWRD
jgi:hypothetical protein